MRMLFISNLQEDSPTIQVRIMPIVSTLRSRGHSVDLLLGKMHSRSGNSRVRYYALRISEIASRILNDARDYDVIFTSKPSSALEGLVKGSVIRKPVVCDFDDLEGLIPSQRLWWTSIPLVKCCDVVFVASRYLFRLLSSVNHNIVYLPNPIPFLGTSLGRNENKDSNNLLWISSESDQEADLVFRSLELLPEAKLVIVGKHGERHSTFHISSKPSLKDRIILKGWVNEEELTKICSACKLGLLPFPYTPWFMSKSPGRLMTMIARELPILVTVGEPRYVVERFGNGLVAKPDPADIAQKVREMMLDIEEFRRRAMGAKTYMSYYCSIESLVSKIEKILYRVVVRG